MIEQKRSKLAWGLILISSWLLLNGVGLLVSQILRLAGIETYEILKLDAGYAAIDTGIVVMDILLASPIYILGGILLWRRHYWGLILSVASLVELTYVMGMFAIALTQLNLWHQLQIKDILVTLLTLPINILALVYLVYRYARVYPGGRLD
jgi:hypothetical protein